MSKEINYIFFKNFISLTFNQGINIIIAIVVTPILFQNLGSINYGLIELAFSIFMLLSILISYGYHLNGPKRISCIDNIPNEFSLINEIISLRLFIALIISLFILLISHQTNLFENYSLIIIFSLPILFSEVLNPLFYLQGKNQLFTLSKINALSKVAYFILIYLFIKNYSDAFMVNFFYGSTIFLVYLFFWLSLFLKNKSKFIISNINTLIQKLKENLEFFLSSVAGHISLYSGLILLKFFVDNKELGKFALSNRIVFFLRMIPVFIVQSTLQNATLVLKKNKHDLNNHLNYYYYRGIALTFLISLAFSLFSNSIIVLFSGQQIAYSAQILSILSFIPFLAMLNVKNLLTILIHEKKIILNKATWYSAIFTIISSLILSYFFKGFGLACALLISEFSSFIIHSTLLSFEKKNN